MDETSIYKFYKQLDRAHFIDNGSKPFAHYDEALPIGHGQTISQPSLVLQMTLCLAPDKNCRTLEIGTGSGYQTALLAEFSDHVFTVEKISELSVSARKRLDKLGYGNIEYLIGDGSAGWPLYAPYDRIMVTAAARQVPEELVEQLSLNGRMMIPVGERYNQDLLLIKKDESGKISRETVNKVIFVELKGKYGWQI
ncbi:MAG: protein-L-isoaspartate(D-aspartate) O-methyltransferase [Clostridia bacterium]